MRPKENKERSMASELRRLTFFGVKPTDTDKAADELLQENQREPLSRLVEIIRRYTGFVRHITRRYYRVMNTNYVKIYFDGERNRENGLSPFCLTVSLSGFSDIPHIDGNAGFLSISVVDCVDVHWLVDWLQAKLQGENNEVAS